MELTQGQMETDGAPLFIPKEALEKAERQTAEIKKKMSPPGALGLPELLDQRRCEFGIPDSAFRVQAAFNKIFIHQVQDIMLEKGTWGDTGIIIPESAEKSRKKSAPRGIVVSAGLTALDHLRTHGMDLGHIVTYVRTAPFRVEYDLIGGEIMYLLTLVTSDIWGSEDTATAIRKKRLTLACVDGSHVYADEAGTTLKPKTLSGDE